jgi:TPR repeat protein
VGIEENPEEAASWFRRAAEQGHQFAQGLLGEISLEGNGLPARKPSPCAG